MSQYLTLSIAQLNPIVGGFRHNTQLILDAIEQATQEGADVVVFPELVITGYPPEEFRKDHNISTILFSLINSIKDKLCIMTKTAYYRIKLGD
jgi:NAD+ synthase (glutamine-hydrolysing)